jgi:hypothetical protein
LAQQALGECSFESSPGRRYLAVWTTRLLDLARLAVAAEAGLAEARHGDRKVDTFQLPLGFAGLDLSFWSQGSDPLHNT